MVKVDYDGTPLITPRTVAELEKSYGSGVLIFFNTQQEKEYGIGRQYTGKPLEPNQCRIPQIIAERNNFTVGSKIWI